MATVMDKDFVYLGPRKVAVWPAGRAMAQLGDPAIRVTNFDDIDLYHPTLTARLMELEKTPEIAVRYSMAGGGTKIHDLEKRGLPEIDLIVARGRAMFRRLFNVQDPVIDSAWANIYRRGDYIMPHSHVRCTAAILYCLERGDTDVKERESGMFSFIDPRLAACCPERKGFFTHPLVPNLQPGTMMIFPGQLTHFVSPYMGETPRITISMNINPEALPGTAFDVMKQKFSDSDAMPMKTD